MQQGGRLRQQGCHALLVSPTLMWHLLGRERAGDQRQTSCGQVPITVAGRAGTACFPPLLHTDL